MLLALLAAWMANPASSAVYGTYPECVAPAMGLCTHAWALHHDAESTPAHLHSCACLPHARDWTGELVPAAGAFDFDLVVVAFADPGEITWSRVQWEGDTYDQVSHSWRCSSSSTNPDGEHPECAWVQTHRYDPSLANAGMDELRVTPNVGENRHGLRHFASAKWQLWAEPGGDLYRADPYPIADSWYEGFGYCGVRVGITELFRGASDLGRTMPLVSGVARFAVDHRQCDGFSASEIRSVLWIDAHLHAHSDAWRRGAPNAPFTVYDRDGLFDGEAVLDTTTLCDGRHTWYAATFGDDGEILHQGALEGWLETRNGNPPCDGPELPEWAQVEIRRCTSDNPRACGRSWRCGLLGIELLAVLALAVPLQALQRAARRTS